MIIDKEQHREMLLEIINKTGFPGQFVELASELKAAVRDAEVTEAGKPNGDARMVEGRIGAS